MSLKQIHFLDAPEGGRQLRDRITEQSSDAQSPLIVAFLASEDNDSPQGLFVHPDSLEKTRNDEQEGGVPLLGIIIFVRNQMSEVQGRFLEKAKALELSKICMILDQVPQAIERVMRQSGLTVFHAADRDTDDIIQYLLE